MSLLKKVIKIEILVILSSVGLLVNCYVDDVSFRKMLSGYELRIEVHTVIISFGVFWHMYGHLKTNSGPMGESEYEFDLTVFSTSDYK